MFLLRGYMVNIGCPKLYAMTHVFLKKFGVPGLQCKLNENEQFLPKLTIPEFFFQESITTSGFYFYCLLILCSFFILDFHHLFSLITYCTYTLIIIIAEYTLVHSLQE